MRFLLQPLPSFFSLTGVQGGCILVLGGVHRADMIGFLFLHGYKCATSTQTIHRRRRGIIGNGYGGNPTQTIRLSVEDADEESNVQDAREESWN